MILLIILSLLNLAAVVCLIYRDKRFYDRLERTIGLAPAEKFTPVSIFPRFGRTGSGERATSSRVSIVRREIEREEAESQRLQVI